MSTPPRIAALLVAVLAVLTACASDSGSPHASTTGRLGCNQPASQHRHARLGFAVGYTAVSDDVEAVNADLDGMAATGVCWLRFDIDWSRIEREPGQLDWSATDRAVRGAMTRGLEVVAAIGYTPEWARPSGTSDKHPPEDAAAFATFAADAARRYAPLGVKVWEIWNEPNIDVFWQPRPDPEAYADLLVQASDAIRTVDRQAYIITAGLSPASNAKDGSDVAPVTFLEAVYAAGAGDSFDAVGMHPYSYPVSPTDEVPLNHFATVTPALRDVMADNGDDAKPIWGTEYGAPTGGARQAVSVETQAQFLADAMERWEEWEWTGPLLIYAWRDRGTDLRDREQNFGLLHHDGVAKPALDVLLDVTGGSPPS